MAKKKEEINYAAELKERFDRWDYLHENGGSDPFWSDGSNMNLVRNHIIYYKREIEENMNQEEYPKIYYRDTPPKTDENYMAQPDKIRANAKSALEKFNNDSNLKFLIKKLPRLDNKFAKQISIGYVIGSATSLKNAIDKDSLVEMRRYGTGEMYLESFKSCAEKVKGYRPPESAQLSLFEILDDDEDETFEISM
ncbi:MAG: hypothetical protein Q4C12_05855 [Clostridia bacterium]|nr:hypothetical protein [Clostridia bacterium]